jgi:epoxyqueuosine reductase
MDVAGFQSTARRFAQEAGFDLCGVAPVQEFRELRYFPGWIDQGKAGEMNYLQTRNEHGELKRADLKNAAPWAKSVVVCGLNYNSDSTHSIDPAPSSAGWISRYAWFRQADYHDAVLRRLRDLESRLKAESSQPIRTWCYVDTGPVIERVYAKYAGLGWIGKNTCLINEEIGSWVFLGVILTDIELGDVATLPPTDRCGSCTRCIEACPTEALSPYEMDARRCIAYLTIEKRGDIPESLRPGIGRQIFGCDICQDVCPWNGAVNETKRLPVSAVAEFEPVPELINPDLEWLAGLSREDFRRVFRHSPIKRVKYEGFRRNVAVAMGNSKDLSFRTRLEALANDENETVAGHARWALARLLE